MKKSKPDEEMGSGSDGENFISSHFSDALELRTKALEEHLAAKRIFDENSSDANLDRYCQTKTNKHLVRAWCQANRDNLRINIRQAFDDMIDQEIATEPSCTWSGRYIKDCDHSEDPWRDEYDENAHDVDSDIQKFLVPVLGPNCADRIKWACGQIDDTIWLPGAVREFFQNDPLPAPSYKTTTMLGLLEHWNKQESEEYMIEDVYPACQSLEQSTQLKAWFESIPFRE